MAKNSNKRIATSLSETSKLHKGSRCVCVLRAGAEDIVPAVHVRDIDLDVATKVCSDVQDTTLSLVELHLDNFEKVRADCKLVRALALLDHDKHKQEKLGKCRLGIFAFHRQPMTLLLYEEDKNTKMITDMIEPQLYPVVDFLYFQKAIQNAICQGNIKPQKSAGARGYMPNELCAYNLFPQVGPVKAAMRLDMACAALKRESARDVYGRPIMGVILRKQDNNKGIPHWHIMYDLPNGVFNPDNAANIDHVIPKTKGGSLGLRNLQLMKSKDNWYKGCQDAPDVNQERRKSARVLALLEHGIEKSHKSGKMKEELYNRLRDVIAFEKEDCEMPETGVARDIISKTAAIAKNPKDALSSGANSVKKMICMGFSKQMLRFQKTGLSDEED